MSSSVPQLVTHGVFGYATDTSPDNVFDDLHTVGKWPFWQLITKVTSVAIWTVTNPDKITCIQITYDCNAGIYGAVDNSSGSEPILRAIKFKLSNGSVYGPFPTPPNATQWLAVSESEIIGFCGSTASNGNLDTIGVYTKT
ncbi:hypothetical protein H0H92_005958 [Tricholoma furcatifolium]|nr:hypothetical protein H0H92_005958 [Tricholoma furcatifolium]